MSSASEASSRRRRGAAASWGSLDLVRAKAQTLWRNGSILRALNSHPADSGDEAPSPRPFPIRVRLPGPSGEQVADDFAAVRSWAAALVADAERAGCRIELRPVRAGALGRQQLPWAGWLDTPQDALRLLGRNAASEAARFEDLLRLADEHGPWARQVALSRPFEVLTAEVNWHALLATTTWFLTNPRPGVHPRAIPVEGAHTKLIESRRALLTRLLDAALPAEAVNVDAPTFEGRYGLATAPRTAHLRAAGSVVGLPHLAEAEVVWPLEGLAGIDPLERGVTDVLVVENLLPLQRVPLVPGRLVLWGRGYAVAHLLSSLPWLRTVPIRYWGDLDTHGFAILALAREALPHLSSVLMDAATLRGHLPRAGTEPTPRSDDLVGLRDDEQEVYDLLRTDALGTAVRIEQEHLAEAAVRAAIRELTPP